MHKMTIDLYLVTYCWNRFYREKTWWKVWNRSWWWRKL